ncbi:uncharacterized protein LOC113750651 [Coffea eugenioides]|uniref:uncharacterized protein LOC113750651 n=1 Tax=Coffea eugenioides TaxID=49369 RepID=UPI000F611F87|nr:uncharacterized protein LOC113750651 [Coffea eugenioides]
MFSSKSKAFFIDGPGGTRKTFLYRSLLSALRSQGYIAIAVATSGVAASIFSRGRTAHSRIKIPLDFSRSKTWREPVDKNGEVTLPSDLVIPYHNKNDSLGRLIHCVFLDLHLYSTDPYQMINRYILSPTNSSVDEHNEFYIALSRLRTSDIVKVLIVPETFDDIKIDNRTRNIIFSEVFHLARMMAQIIPMKDILPGA